MKCEICGDKILKNEDVKIEKGEVILYICNGCNELLAKHRTDGEYLEKVKKLVENNEKK